MNVNQTEPMNSLLASALKLAKSSGQNRVMPFHLLTAMVDTPEISDYLESHGYPVEALRSGINRIYPEFKRTNIADIVSHFATHAGNITYDASTINLWNIAKEWPRKDNSDSPGYLELLYLLDYKGDKASQIAMHNFTNVSDEQLLQMIKKERNAQPAAFAPPGTEQNAPSALPDPSTAGKLPVGNKEFQEFLAHRQRLLNIDVPMKKNVIGQDKAIDTLHDAVKQNMAGLCEEDKPLGSFLFVGPTGVGKTEVAKQLAAELDVELVRFDMSEYMERHSVSRLIGAPPGYVGHDQAGLMETKVNAHKNCVLLLDEIEKAHPAVFNILLQVMDNGILTGSNGEEIDFRNVILIMTSNAGAKEANEPQKEFGYIHFNKNNTQFDNDLGAYEPALKDLFTPEFRNRLDATIIMDKISKADMLRIAENQIKLLNNLKAAQTYDLQFSATPEALQAIVDIGYDENMGARPIKRVIKDHIKKALADTILKENLSVADIVIDYNGDDFIFKSTPRTTGLNINPGNDNRNSAPTAPQHYLNNPIPA